MSIINSVEYDFLYLNSFFSYKSSIVPILLKKLNRISNKSIVLAPRGEFSLGALNLKKLKKSVYIKLSKFLGLYTKVIWHATADIEKENIMDIFGDKIEIKVAKNLTANYKELKYEKNIKKVKEKLKIVFISRIHPSKNLKKAIELLMVIKGDIEFNIYGPLQDKSYWSECKMLIKKLPSNKKVFYKGAIAQKKVIDVFNQNHIFLFPTLGENYGHVISEALIGGCPVIISDRTPWRGLEEKKAGWDINLKDEIKFISVLNTFVDMSSRDYSLLSKNAFNYGKEMSNTEENINESYKLFDVERY